MTVSDLLTFPDIEAGLISWATTLDSIKDLTPGDPLKHVGEELPSQYESRLPFLEISDRGGRTDGLTWYPEVEFFAFAQDRETARSMLAEVFAKIGVYPRKFGGISVDSVQVTLYPRRSKNQEPDERTYCFSGEATISLRRQKGN